MTNPIMIWVVNEGRYHGRRTGRETLAVIELVLTQSARQTAPKTSVYHSLFNAAVGVYATIAEEWPMRSLLVYSRPTHICHHNFFFIDGTFGDDFAVWSAYKTLSPEFDTIAACRCFVADAVCRRDIAAIGDRVAALDCFPSVILRFAKLLLFRRVPADCCWIENNLSAMQRCEARSFRIPLV